MLVHACVAHVCRVSVTNPARNVVLRWRSGECSNVPPKQSLKRFEAMPITSTIPSPGRCRGQQMLQFH